MESKNKDSNENAALQIRLEDGTVFAIGGVKSILTELVEKEKLSMESQVFSIGPVESDDAEKIPEGSPKHQDKYEIKHEIDRGGMGSILLAMDLDLRRRIAMKVLIEGSRSSPQLCERFIKEAQVTGFLEHPNIVPIHELSADANHKPFFTMKLIAGETFDTVLRKLSEGDPDYKRQFPLRRVLGIFIQVCNAVSFAHSRGIIHRDIKPANVMIGEYGEVLLMDWGLAKIQGYEEMLSPFPITDDSDFGKTQEGSVLGTPYYMPPEQASGDIGQTDERSDIFSLGAMLYEIMTGKHLYSGKTLSDVLKKARSADFLPPSKRRGMVQKDLESICLRACAARKDDRYQTVTQLVDELKAFLDHRVVPEYRLKVWQELIQILAIGAFFGVLFPLVVFRDLRYILMFVHAPSFLVLIGSALCYQLLITGPHLTFPVVRTKGLPGGAVLKSDILVDGAFVGGILGSIVGFLSMVSAMHEPVDAASVGPNISLAFEVLLYFYIFFLVLQLDAVRKSRRNSLFGNISPARPVRLFQYSVLFFLPNIVALLIMLNTGQHVELAALLTFTSNSLPDIVGYTTLITISSLAATVVYHRFIFTFSELAAAFEHLFAFFAGNEVDDENRVHAGAVLRFFSGSFLIFTLSFCALTEISTMAVIEEIEELAQVHLKNLFPAFLSLIAYVVFNYVLLRMFCVDGGYKTSRKTMIQALMATYVDKHGGFWTEAKPATVIIVVGNVAILVIGAFIMVASGMEARIGLPQLLGGALIVSAIVAAYLHRRRLRRSCRPSRDGSNQL